MSESPSSGRESHGREERKPPEEEEESGLAAALDSFVDWARQEVDAEGILGLPPLRLGEMLEPGTVLGDYELVRRLGMGGMGVVFEARQRHVLGRRVALKVLRSAFETEELSRRFRREVAAVAGLDHPAIVPVVDARVEGGTPYYVMKYVEGVSASTLIRELRNGPSIPSECAPVRRFVERSARASAEAAEAVPVSREGSSTGPESSWEEPYTRWIARLGLQLAEALHYAHERGFVHRDVKPGNVLVTPRGRGVLVDFGLVSMVGEEALTRTGEFLGTLEYASPEQVRGETLDARSDVYSLGATLYELLSLARPFGNCTHSELVQRIERDDPAPFAREVPLDLRTIVGTALARSPGKRYASAGALAADLRAFLAGQPIRARPPGWSQRAMRVVRRNPRVVAAALGIFLALGGLRVVAHRSAAELVSQGRSELEQALVERARLDRLLAEHAPLLTRHPRDHKRLLEVRKEIEAARGSTAATLRAARVHLEQAFEHVAGYGPAHEGLALVASEGLRQALRDHRDVLAPGSLSELEQELERHDRTGEFAALRAHGGWVSLTSVPTVARATLEGGPAPLVLSTPLERLELPEGSYTVLVEAHGHVPVRLPFLVRRASADEGGHARPGRALAVQLLPLGAVPEGFAYVPAGETLVDDDPPRWECVDSFLIAQHEAAWRELVAWANAREAELGVRLTLSPELPLRRDDSGWMLASEVEPDWPVSGATAMEMIEWTKWLDGRIGSAPADWCSSVPTRAEWVRAARGADGRPYPWGWEFDGAKCASYTWGPHYGHDATPLPIGSFPADVSPFGVYDLAGSAAEITLDLHQPRPGEHTTCGGSYWCDDPDDFRVTATREDENDRPREDVGFRLVLRPFPQALRPSTGPPASFRDDFERPDSPEVGSGWLEFASTPFGSPMDPHAIEDCSIQSGRLVCRGGLGQFSESSSAWHPIRVPESGCTVRARIQATRASTSSGPEADARFFGLSVGGGLRISESDQLAAIQLSFAGVASLGVSSAQDSKEDSGLDPAAPMLFELSIRPGLTQGRIWPADGEPSDGVVLALEAIPGPPNPHFVGLVVPNFVGARVEAEWVEVLVH